MSWYTKPLACPTCGEKRQFDGLNGYWCERCGRKEYAGIKPLSYDDGGEG